MTLNKVIDDKSLIDRIKTLESIQDIIKLKSVYCRYCDADYDPKKLANLFCEDGILNLGKKFGIYKGKNEIINHFEEISQQFVFASHLVTNPEINIEDGIKAFGTWQLIMPCNLHINDKTDSMWLFGEYQDKFIFTNGEWKFLEIKVIHRIFEKHLDGWASSSMN